MKNKPFNKQVITLVMGSLIIYSVQALALSSNNNQELTNAKAWGESELLIAQARVAQTPNSQALTPREKNDLAVAVRAGESCLSPVIAALQTAPIPQSEKDSIARAFSQVQSIFGPAVARATAVNQTKTKGDARSIAQTFSLVQSDLGPVFAHLKVRANSPGGETLARAVSSAEFCFGSALAKIQAIAR